MKVIKSYIDDNGFDAGSRMDILSEQLLNYFSEIPSDFEKEPYRDYILENLNTHDKSLLQAQLTKCFGITEFHDLSIKPNENTSFWFDSSCFDGEKKLYDGLVRLLDFYGWYITKNLVMAGRIAVSPKYSKNVTSLIKSEYFGIAYHICRKDDLRSILKNGLRCKTARNDYRKFPSRIYLVADKPENIRQTVTDVIHETRFLPEYEFAIVKVRINGNVYSDDMMDNPNTFFTYTNIPSNYILNCWMLEDFVSVKNR